MAAAKKAEVFDPIASILQAWGTNGRINAYLVANVPDEAWHAKPPGGKGRTVAAIFAHIHNVRLMWLKSVDKDAALPEKLDGELCSKAGVMSALVESEAALTTVLDAALHGDGKVRGFKPDAGGFAAYLLAHEAHHRGQITQLCRLVGFAVSQSTNFGLWAWGTR